MIEGWLFDGEVALRRRVVVAVDGTDLHLTDEGGSRTAVPLTALLPVEQRREESAYGLAGRLGWRLVLPHPLPAVLAEALPRGGRYGAWIDRVGLWRAAAVGLVASALLMFVVWSLPHWLAPLVPDRWLKAYGTALVGDFGGRFCEGPGGQAALDRLVARLSPADAGARVRVVNIPIVNAAALPGGDIILFRELVTDAKSPEELAGVLAHELSHVRNRDVAEAMVRELGFGILVGAFGGNVGANAHMLASLSYGREAESRADGDAIAMLRRARISPAPTAGFFERLAKEGGETRFDDAIVYLSTHPLSKGRAARFRQAALPVPAMPLLTRDEWEALVDICHNDPKQRGRGRFRP